MSDRQRHADVRPVHRLEFEQLEDRRLLSAVAHGGEHGALAAEQSDDVIFADTLVFYNNSTFGTTSPATKVAYRPGDGVITSASMTSYSRGLNGIAVQITGSAGPVSLSDFSFAMSDQGTGPNNVNTPSTWAAAPSPIGLTVISDTPVVGTDRVEITWADNAIENRYLEVTSLGGAKYYFGNIIGDTFNDSAPTVWLTTAVDETVIQDAIISLASIDSLLDLDKNGVHLASDRIVTRSNTIFALNKLHLTFPAPEPEPTADQSAAAAITAVASGVAMARSREDAAADIDGETIAAAVPAAGSRVAKSVKAAAARSSANQVAREVVGRLDEATGDLLDALLDDLRQHRRSG